jgi:RNA polymerase sigma-70 factor (ECF subfamily)
MIYCLVPGDLAPRLHELLRRHFGDRDDVEVVIERRGSDRRSGAERRPSDAGSPAGAGAGSPAPAGAAAGPGVERRRVLGSGRRVAERRAVAVVGESLVLPRRAARFADRLAFVERLEPASSHAEDIDTARLVARIQAGDKDAFALLYVRYFDRVFSYLRLLLHSSDEAEDATQQVFLKLFGALPSYRPREKPFRAWLFTVVRNLALNQLRANGRLETVDPYELDRRRDAPVEEADLDALSWVSDRELLVLIERLPLAQRQVLTLRYMLDLAPSEIAGVLDRTPGDVRILQHRALGFLRERLESLGRAPARPDRHVRMRRGVHEAGVLRARRFSLL